MEAAVVGSVPVGGEAPAPAAPAPIQRTIGTPETRQGRARPGDFSARMERASEAEGFGGAEGERRQLRTEDPSVTPKQRAGSDINDDLSNLEDDSLATVEPEQEAIDPEYTDPADVAKQEFMGKLAEALEQGRLPMDMLGELLIEKTLPNGRKVDLTLSEIDRGYMRQGDYTRKLKEVQQLAGRAQNVLDVERGRNQSWQNDEIMLRDILNMGLADSLDRMVTRYARQVVEFRAKPLHEQQDIMRSRQIADMQRRYEQQIAQLQRANQPQQPDQDEITRHFQAQLAQLLPPAFKAFRLGVYPNAKDKFLENIAALYEGGPCTRELVDRACQSTLDELEDMARLAAGAARPARRAPGLPARPLSGQTGRGVQQNGGGARRARPSDFANKFGQGF